jgi:hypothetical protein
VEIADMTISMYQASVGVFTQFLGSLSDLLDHASVYAEARKIDPSILVHSRLYPNMYDLSRQVGEANRHAILACVLLAGVSPPVFADTEPDMAELKARIATTIEFLRSLRPIRSTAPATRRWLLRFATAPSESSPASRCC